jgi:mRNA interferase RelE/StbE
VAYEIRLHRSVIKKLATLDPRHRSRIRERIDSLRDEPRPSGVVRLSGDREVYRVRVGDHRILYRIFDAQLVVFVIDADHRSRIYRAR